MIKVVLCACSTDGNDGQPHSV